MSDPGTREGSTAAPIIVTLAMDAVATGTFARLRAAHFPPSLNRVPPHLTLFHHLPGEAADEVAAAARKATARDAFDVTVEPPRSIGRGVAFPCTATPLGEVRAVIASAFEGRLTRQDAQGWRPHVTVQNKVSPEEAKRTLAQLERAYVPWRFRALGLLVWDYLGGPWRLRATVPLDDVETRDMPVPAMPGEGR